MLSGLVTRLLVAVLLAAASLGLGAGAAAAATDADGCYTVQVRDDVGRLTFQRVCPGDEGGPGGSDGGEGPAPTCELEGLGDFCLDGVSCWSNVPAAIPPTPEEEAARPTPESVWIYRRCDENPDHPLSGYFWSEDEGPSLDTLAREAFAALVTPAFTVGFNPPGRAVVNFPTWFWAETATAGEIRSGGALGVVAIGSPDRLEVDPGDGSGVRSCTFSTGASAACSYTYPRSSAGQPAAGSGDPAFTARARLVYDVRFEAYGSPLTLPGLPDSLTSPWVERAVPVAEIQTVVR